MDLEFFASKAQMASGLQSRYSTPFDSLNSRRAVSAWVLYDRDRVACSAYAGRILRAGHRGWHSVSQTLGGDIDQEIER
jgi:hypothetical protein